MCGQLRGVTLERNDDDYQTFMGGKIVVDGVENPHERAIISTHEAGVHIYGTMYNSDDY